MNFKRKKSKPARAGCLLCKPWKATGNSLGAKKKQDRIGLVLEREEFKSFLR